MLNMLVGKARHEEVRVIVVWLVAHAYALDAGLAGGGFEILGEELGLFVKVVAGSLSL